MKTEIRTLPVRDDVSLVVEMAGDGDPLVLMPGLGCSSRCFHLMIPALVKRGFSVVAVNPRGIGGSSGPLEGITVHDLADDVVGAIETLDIAPVHVVGWAWGSQLARCVAADAPESIRSVILLAGGRAAPEPEAVAALTRLMANAYAKSDERTRDLALVFFAPASDATLGEWIDFGHWTEGMAAQQSAGVAKAREDWAAAGGKSMLAIAPREDRFIPAENAHALRNEFGDRVRVVDLPDAGHGLLVEQPQTIADIISDWVYGGK